MFVRDTHAARSRAFRCARSTVVGPALSAQALAARPAAHASAFTLFMTRLGMDDDGCHGAWSHHRAMDGPAPGACIRREAATAISLHENGAPAGAASSSPVPRRQRLPVRRGTIPLRRFFSSAPIAAHTIGTELG